MPRPTKAAAVTVGHFTADELARRSEGETKLRGGSDTLKPPAYLSKGQKNIFRYIVKNLESSGILGNLDIYVLSECSICVDRMQSIETKLNATEELDPGLVALKEKYSRIFFRCCNELSLSPQSRAKLANSAVSAADENPLLTLLKEDE